MARSNDLSESTRASIITLRCVVGLPHAEIAKQLNLTPTTVRSVYSRICKAALTNNISDLLLYYGRKQGSGRSLKILPSSEAANAIRIAVR